MFDAVVSFLRPLARSVRFADVIDVLLVAAFLYAFLTWVRRDTQPGTTWRLIVVLLCFAAVHLLAGMFSMYLMEHLLGALSIAFLVAAVVLFQSEIRRMIDRIGAFSFQQPAASKRSDQTIDVITEAAEHMARDKTGALMVVRGRDTWEGVTQGGIPLEGRLSLPLLYSIFNEKTPGHDGAVLIEDDRAVRFGTHLPLADDLPEASRAGGTRHAAALGLAEQCDAFVIVVSEERGTVSVAERGQLVEMESVGDLRERLGRFWEEHYSPKAVKARWWGKASAQTALLSVFIASFFWLAFAYEPGSTYRTLTLPVEFRNVEPTWMIEEPQPPEVEVSLSGSERAFQLIDPSQLTVSFPLADLQAGANLLPITEDHLDLPSGLRLQRAEPQAVRVRALRLRSIRLPVQVQSTKPLSDTLRLRAEPDSAQLMVPRNSETVPDAILTETVSVDSLRTVSSMQVGLLPPEGTRLSNKQRRTVRVHLEPAEGPAGSSNE